MPRSAVRECGVALASCLLLALACGPPPEFRSASPEDLARLDLLCARVETAFAASGHTRFVGTDGEIEGDLDVRVAPPDRAWLQVRSRALFGMVGNTVEVSLPGDGYLLVHDQRDDRLERVPYDSTVAAAVCPAGGPGLLLALVGGKVPCDLVRGAAGPATVSVSGGTTRLRLDLAAAAGGGILLIGMNGGDLVDLEWWVADERRLSVRYARYVPVGSGRIPTRIVAEAPTAGVRAEIDLRHPEPRAGFGPEAFEVGRNGNLPPNRGVDHG
jgi:hypothetical protein